jgi:spore coat protein CotF
MLKKLVKKQQKEQQNVNVKPQKEDLMRLKQVKL